MKKYLCLLLILALLLCACAAPAAVPEEPTREYTDSLGRTLSLPETIDTIAITGPLSQVYILPLAGDMLVGVSNAYAEDAQAYLPADIYEKTEIGQLYGGKGEMDLEALRSIRHIPYLWFSRSSLQMVDESRFAQTSAYR